MDVNGYYNRIEREHDEFKNALFHVPNLAALWLQHKNWSEETFGKIGGPIGPLKHLKLEVDEAMQNPLDVTEYVDCLFLIFDAARRAGFDLDHLVKAGFQKLEINKQRNYPRPKDGEPSLHIK